MGAFSALRKFFAREQSQLVVPIDDHFIQLDRAAAAERMNLVVHGSEQGRQELPPTDMAIPDHVEAEILVEIASHNSRAQIDAANWLKGYDDRLAQLGLLAELSSIRGEARRAVSDFIAEATIWRNRLSTKASGITEAGDDLRRFKADNRLRRPAYVLPHPAVTWATIGVAWLFESIINTSFLRVNDDMGFLGGFFAAVTISFLNVVLACLVARLAWPQLAHVRPVRRLYGWMGVTVWLAVMLAWNLGAAHYRDAKALGAERPDHEALGLLFAQPLQLDSIYTWGLLILGIVCSIIAGIAAFKMEDPYPHYGEISRQYEGRCEDYAHEITEAGSALRAIRDEAIDGAEEVRSELGQQFGERERVLGARQSFLQRYAEYSAQLELTGRALLELYRSANRQARATPAPPHFGKQWSLDRPAAHAVPPTAANDVELKAAERALEEAVVQICDHFDAAIQTFETIETLKQRATDGPL